MSKGIKFDKNKKINGLVRKMSFQKRLHRLNRQTQTQTQTQLVCEGLELKKPRPLW